MVSPQVKVTEESITAEYTYDHSFVDRDADGNVTVTPIENKFEFKVIPSLAWAVTPHLILSFVQFRLASRCLRQDLCLLDGEETTAPL